MFNLSRHMTPDSFYSDWQVDLQFKLEFKLPDRVIKDAHRGTFPGKCGIPTPVGNHIPRKMYGIPTQVGHRVRTAKTCRDALNIAGAERIKEIKPITRFSPASLQRARPD